MCGAAMVMSKNKHKLLSKATEAGPVTETVVSPDDYNRSHSLLIPIEQKIQYMILDELKGIKKLLEQIARK
jgi:hypothetical protein